VALVVASATEFVTLRTTTKKSPANAERQRQHGQDDEPPGQPVKRFCVRAFFDNAMVSRPGHQEYGAERGCEQTDEMHLFGRFREPIEIVEHDRHKLKIQAMPAHREEPSWLPSHV
jgi:hypothetical protein